MLRISKDNQVDESVYRLKMNSLEVLKTPTASKIATQWLLALMAIGVITLFLPWQQNIRARGTVTAFSPADRPQTVQTAIPGRIKEWKVREGEFVHEGDTIMVLSEIKEKYFDPNMLPRLKEQLDAKSSGISAKETKLVALDQQIIALESLLTLKTEQAENKILQKILKVESDSMAWEASKVDAQIFERQMQGTQTMYDSGLVSLVKWETSRSKLQKAKAKQTSSLNKYNAAKTDLDIAKLELNTVRAEIMGKLSKATSDRSATLADLYDSKGMLAKSKNNYANMEIRSQQYYILAPQDGFVVRALKSGIGETVKAGEAVVNIMPDDPSVAVELFVDAMDVSLLDTGRHVRLQFEGWPALQFAGWPSVSVGTFGGKLSVIDYIDSKPGKYRVLVIPDVESEAGDDYWPKELRQASGAYGWVMLDEVPVWFEIWRQLNGFPPTIDGHSVASKKGKQKSKSKQQP